MGLLFPFGFIYWHLPFLLYMVYFFIFPITLFYFVISEIHNKCEHSLFGRLEVSGKEYKRTRGICIYPTKCLVLLEINTGSFRLLPAASSLCCDEYL